MRDMGHRFSRAAIVLALTLSIAACGGGGGGNEHGGTTNPGIASNGANQSQADTRSREVPVDNDGVGERIDDDSEMDSDQDITVSEAESEADATEPRAETNNATTQTNGIVSNVNTRTDTYTHATTEVTMDTQIETDTCTRMVNFQPVPCDGELAINEVAKESQTESKSCTRMYNFKPVPCDFEPSAADDTNGYTYTDMNTTIETRTNTQTNTNTITNTNTQNQNESVTENGSKTETDAETGSIYEDSDETEQTIVLNCGVEDVASLDVDDEGIDLEEIASSTVGNTYRVSTVNEFNYTASIATSGDLVIIESGTYEDWSLSITSDGVRYIAAEEGVTFFKSASIVITGSNNLFAGFTFQDVSNSLVIDVYGGDNNRITENEFVNIGKDVKDDLATSIIVRDGANRNRVDHNTFRRNRSIGIHIALPDDDTGDMAYSRNTRIDNNVFEDGVAFAGEIPPTSVKIGAVAGEHTLGEACVTVDNNAFNHNEMINVAGYANGIQVLFNTFTKVKKDVAVTLAGASLHIEGNVFERVDIPLSVTGESPTFIDNYILVNGEHRALPTSDGNAP